MSASPIEPDLAAPPPGRGLLRPLAGLLAAPTVALAVLLFALLCAAAALAPILAPQNPYDLAQLDVMDGTLPPLSPAGSGTFTYWLGSDDQGRDMLSAVLYGLRISLGLGLTSAIAAGLIGSLLGLLAAYYRGALDAVIMRAVDLQFSFPSVLIALIIVAVLGKSAFNVLLAIIVVEWAYYARAARAAAMTEMSRDYVEAARAIGCSAPRLILRHVLPNCLPPLIVILMMQIGRAIALEATLSFLGVGVPITEPSLGLLVSNGFNFLLSGEYWISLFPGLTLMAIIIVLNVIGDYLRDLISPHSDF